MNEKATIIVPCYNAEPYIIECLDSILAQTSKNWECIIINDGSPDTEKFEKTIKPFLQNEKFKYVVQENQGLPGARNTGIENATGKYILPLDADDKLNPKAIELMVDLFQKKPETLVVYGDAELFGTRNEPAEVLKKFSLKELLVCNQLFCSSMYKKMDLEENIRYDPYLKIGLEDWEFWLHLQSKHKNRTFEHLPYSTLKKRETNHSMLKEIKKNDDRMEKAHQYIYEKYKNLYHEFYPSYLQLLNQKIFYEKKLENFYHSKYYRFYNAIMKIFK